MIKASITYYKKGSFNKIHLNFTKKEFEKVKKDVLDIKESEYITSASGEFSAYMASNKSEDLKSLSSVL